MKTPFTRDDLTRIDGWIQFANDMSGGRANTRGMKELRAEIESQLETPTDPPRAPAAPRYQLCPVCCGAGVVSRPPGIAADQPTFATTSAGPWPCPTCGGTRVLDTWLAERGATSQSIPNAPQDYTRDEALQVAHVGSLRELVALYVDGFAHQVNAPIGDDADTFTALLDAYVVWQERGDVHSLTCGGGGGPCSGVNLTPKRGLTGGVVLECPACGREQVPGDWLDAMVLAQPVSLFRDRFARHVADLRAQLADAEQRDAENDAELGRIATAIGSVEFMDPPDGGDVSLGKQVARMRAALDEARARTA